VSGCYDAGFSRTGRTALKITLSLVLAGAAGFGVLVLLEALLRSPHGVDHHAALFRFQLSALAGMAVFAGLAILIYVRLSRRG
jgi:hypothetical protein